MAKVFPKSHCYIINLIYIKNIYTYTCNCCKHCVNRACSKRASYLGNTSWPGSPKLISIDDNRSEQVIQLHTPFMIYCTFYNFLFPLGNGRRCLSNFYFFSFLKKVTETPLRYSLESVESKERIKKKLFKILPTMLVQQKFWFLKCPKCLFCQSENISFLKLT